MNNSKDNTVEYEVTQAVAEAMDACKKALPSAEEMRVAKWVELASKLATIHDAFVAQIRNGGKAAIWVSTLKCDKVVDNNGFINIQSNYPTATSVDLERLLSELGYKVVRESSSGGSCNLDVRL